MITPAPVIVSVGEPPEAHAQRGARTIDDLIDGLRELWLAIKPRVDASPLDKSSFLARIGDGWAVARWSAELKMFVVATVLDGAMELPRLPKIEPVKREDGHHEQ